MASHKLKFHPLFVQGLEVAIAYYEAQSKVVGAKFKSATTHN
jgi:hypothetical protein